jgi:hypothetical protein
VTGQIPDMAPGVSKLVDVPGRPGNVDQADRAPLAPRASLYFAACTQQSRLRVFLGLRGLAPYEVDVFEALGAVRG